ncbi:MAG: GGDEF domain-containing protein [Rhodospirillales bacterium]|nr:GGDEF domain-containing protein [Rhodospirillales bacterium]
MSDLHALTPALTAVGENQGEETEGGRSDASGRDEQVPASWDDLSKAGRPRWGWEWAMECLDFAFQPIINIHNGVCFGHEALLRNWRDAGFDSIREVFDSAADAMILNRVENTLRAKAIRKFSAIPGGRHLKLFYNLDNRCMDMPDYRPGTTFKHLEQSALPATALYLEISEQRDITRAGDLERILTAYRHQGFKLVLDDYGVGFSQLKMLYRCEPDVLKIDRFFISGVDSDQRKEMLLGQLVELAHLMGALVVAEGIETVPEFFACKRAGCDLAQGFLIQKPTRNINKLSIRYERIEELSRRDRRSVGDDDRELIRGRMTRIEPLRENTNPLSVLQYFLRYHDVTVVPVVDEDGYPTGVIREADFKEFSYSLYGRDLLQNPHLRPNTEHFLRRCPTVEVSEPLERILKIFATAAIKDGVIITEEMRYIGFLDEHALLEMLNEKNTIAARDQNPLTQLPGNNAIYRYASEVLASGGSGRFFAYLDFDNFKPFNDRYGFRQGDRAIVLFADILNKKMAGQGSFIGHIGGDDFFVGGNGFEEDEFVQQITGILDQFRDEIVSFYDPEERKKGCIQGTNRAGETTCFPLMTVSAAILRLSDGSSTVSVDDVVPAIAVLKKAAKRSRTHTAIADLEDSVSAEKPEPDAG